MRYIFIKLIRFYQVAISPFLGANCRYTPTCSSYAIESLNKLPIHVALWQITKRISRCHPWSQGGYDPVCTHKKKAKEELS